MSRVDIVERARRRAATGDIAGARRLLATLDKVIVIEVNHTEPRK